MSSDMDKKWMNCARKSREYIEGVRSFINFVKNNGGESTLFSCPCKRCFNCNGIVTLGEISLYLLKHGIQSSYTMWRFNGERSVVKAQRGNTSTKGVDINVGDAADNFIPQLILPQYMVQMRMLEKVLV